MPNPANAWDPIRVVPHNPDGAMAREHLQSDGRRSHYAYRQKMRSVEIKAFVNRLYDGSALTFEDGSMHLSFKRKDRAAVRDWRHFQAIKNEVAGPLREAVEIFPAETNLVDAANEYHLWVLPPGAVLNLGFACDVALLPGSDSLDYAAYRHANGLPGGRQRDWEPGLPTGLGLAELVREAAARSGGAEPGVSDSPLDRDDSR